MLHVIKLEALIFVTILGVIIGYRVLTGDINARGLLRDDRTGRLSGGRLQLLIATLVGASAYLMSILAAESNSLPDVSGILLLLVGGGNAGYLGSKIYSHAWANKHIRRFKHE